MPSRLLLGAVVCVTMGCAASEGGTDVRLVETEQRLSGIRPEFLDFLWNNLDATHFEQWYPAEHEGFAWVRAPLAPGDLGAEFSASYRSTEVVGGSPHELVVTYADPASVVRDETDFGYAMVAGVTIDGAGPFRWIVQYAPDGEDLLLQQQLELPAEEDVQAWRAHLEQRMSNLTAFLKDWFQTQYVEGELMTRGTITISPVGSGSSSELEVVVEQRIAKLTPEMVDWWWDNIRDTARYRRWHPTAHHSFEWITPPQNTDDLTYDVGAVQRVVETILGEATLDITWLDPSDVPVPVTYDHHLYAATALTGLSIGGFVVHQYAAHPDGGIVMKSTFRIPPIMSFAEGLGDHCLQEMQFLQYFLPELYAAEYQP